MKRVKTFLGTSLLGGLVVILPVAILIFVVRWILTLITEVIQPLTTLVVKIAQMQTWVAEILVVAVILGSCFAIGVFVRTRLGAMLHSTVENRVLKIAPGYSLIKETVAQILGSNRKSLFVSVALVQLFGSETLASAFITDSHSDGSYTVFVPTGPNPTSGNIFHLKARYVHPVNVPIEDAIKSIISCGVGSTRLIDAYLDQQKMLQNTEEEKMERLPPVHPGEVLLEDFMKPLGLSQYRVAKDIGVSPIRISQIVHGKRAITADTAMRLARYFGTSAEVWVRMQARYDLEIAQDEYGERIEQEVPVLKVA